MAEASSTEDVITLRIRFKSETLEKFAERYAVDLGPNEVFVRTREPLPVGTTLNFDFTLHDGSPLLAGRGTVIWAREPDVARTEPAGMGIRFDNLTPAQPPAAVEDPGAQAAPRTRRQRSPTGPPRPGAVVPRSPAPSSAGARRRARPSPPRPTPRSAEAPTKPADYAVDEDSRAHRDRAHASQLLLRERSGTRRRPARRDGLPDAGLLDDLDDITSPRAEMPLPAPVRARG